MHKICYFYTLSKKNLHFFVFLLTFLEPLNHAFFLLWITQFYFHVPTQQNPLHKAIFPIKSYPHYSVDNSLFQHNNAGFAAADKLFLPDVPFTSFFPVLRKFFT